MKKLYFLLLICFATVSAFGQVGINTTDPKAQLEIKSSNEVTPTNTDGLLIPKVNVFPATNPTIDQQGMLVYLKNPVGANLPGFYYWNFGTLAWIPIGNNNSSGWNITGNAGTTTTTNFIGTTDNVNVVFKRNNVRAGFLGTDNTSFGLSALNPLSTGFSNTATGSFALQNNTTGIENTANGRSALQLNTTGTGNTANGGFALFVNTTGTGNTALGLSALQSNTTGFNNTANGVSALFSNTSGTLNTANGVSALDSNTTGNSNTANGISALGSNTTGSNNTANGHLALSSNTTGIENSSLGSFSNVIVNNLNNATAIGARATVGASNSLVLGSINGVNGATASVNVGIGTQIPLDKLHVVGNIRMVDGNQAAGKVLASDANGTATWQNASANAWGLTGNTGTNPATNFIGTSDNFDLVLKTNDTDNFRIKNDGRIEIGNNGVNPVYLGATSLSKKLYIATETATNNIVFQASNAASDPVSMYFGASRGNIAIPTIAAANQNISNLFFSGYDGTQFVNSSSINARLDGTPGLNSMPGMLQFQTTPVGSSATITRMVIRSSGNIGIGTPTPLDKLHVVGNIRMVDGNEAAGKVLTSDVNGRATWQVNPANNAWGLTGNAGTNATNNFIGTTDNVDVVFKRNDGFAGLIGSTNTSFGLSALNPLTTGSNNTAIGFSALLDNTTGISNTSIGYNALPNNTTGSDNTVIGVAAMVTSTTGNLNTAIGRLTLFDNTTGSNNTANGYNSLGNNTTGTNNTAVGVNSLSAINVGSFNTAIGADANVSSTILTNATAIGSRALAGNSNVLILGSVNGINGATSSVNVGIGTTSPQTRLEVVDENVITSSTLEGNLNVITNNPQAIDIGASISLGGTNNDAGTIYRTFATVEGRKSNSTTTNSAGYLLFKTANTTLTEKMRITNLGDVGIGTANPGGQFELSLNEGRKPTSNTWIIPSDARLKIVNGNYEKGLTEILQLKPIKYNYKNTDKKTFEAEVLNKQAYGFLAQEVQPLFPEAVGVDDDGYLNFDLHPILIASVNAFKELNQKSEALQLENQSLKKEIEAQNQTISEILNRLKVLENKN